MILNSKTMFKISLFGWEVVILRYPKTTKKEIGHGIQPIGAYIKREGQYLIACNEKGEYIPRQVGLTINDNINDISTVTVEYIFAGIYEESKGDRVFSDTVKDVKLEASRYISNNPYRCDNPDL